jgi:hypothetical protein
VGFLSKFWLSPPPTLPLSDDARDWVDDRFQRLEHVLGRSRMLDAQVLLPNGYYFPDRYDLTPATAELLFQRICGYMSVDRSKVELEIFPDETEELREILPFWNNASDGCAGLYLHDAASDHPGSADARKRHLVALRSSMLKDQFSLVATIAHELGHVILIGGGLLDPTTTSDHEALTDLLTVFLGFGVFNANCAARFRQYHDSFRQGWSMQRLGYLSQEAYGYALARFALERGEDRPRWARELSPNVSAFFKSSAAWLAKNPPRV